MGESTSDPDAAARAMRASLDRIRHAPLSITVTGHPGTGRATLAAAVRRCFGVRVAVTDGRAKPAADLTLHVLGAGVRACDREFLAELRGPVLVVAGKADLRSDPVSVAEAAAEILARPVWAVSGLLATASVTDDLWAALRRWADDGRTVPPLAASFGEAESASGDRPDAGERDLRMLALGELGGAGLRAALAYCAAGPEAEPDPAGLARELVALSGMLALAGPIRECGAAIAVERERRHRRAVAVLAARRSLHSGRGARALR